jgi:hypothetical protein
MQQLDSSLGRSYGLWTLFTVVASLVCLIIISTAGGLAGKIVILVVAPPLLLLNIVGVVLLAYVHWMGDRHPFFPHWLFPKLTMHGRRLPGALMRVLDHFFALNLAWALLYMVLWTWDGAEEHDTYFELLLRAARHDVWAAWVVFVFFAFHVFVTFGVAEIALVHVVSYVLVVMDSIVSWLVIALILALVVAYAYDLAKQRKREKSAEDVERKDVAAAAATGREYQIVSGGGSDDDRATAVFKL